MQRLAWLFAVLPLAACEVPPPPLGQGLPNDWGGAKSAFAQRVQARFPAGSSEIEMKKELKREGFVFSAQQYGVRGMPFQAARSSGEVVCKIDYVVSWDAAAGQITAIDGRYLYACL